MKILDYFKLLRPRGAAEISDGAKEEKKVEYIELIYDLIFVYMIGRNSSLIHILGNGFVDLGLFSTYILSTLITLQIWYHTTLFINRYGQNGTSEYVGMFVNMYLLYYMGTGTTAEWQSYYMRYNVAWGLILVNLGLQYYLKLRQSKAAMPWENAHIRHYMRLLFTQAAIVFISVPLFPILKFPLSPLSLIYGLAAVRLSGDTNNLIHLDFRHLSERVMLYIVFTFGEMIVAISSYFSGAVTPTSVYFSLMSFLIVAGLFTSYGFMYDRVLDRDYETAGNDYMLIHIFMIAALNDITAGLEFMREPEVNERFKVAFIVASLLLYFLFLFMTGKYARVRYEQSRRFLLKLAALSALFVAAMALCYHNNYISIAVTVAYVYAVPLLSVANYRRQLAGD